MIQMKEFNSKYQIAISNSNININISINNDINININIDINIDIDINIIISRSSGDKSVHLVAHSCLTIRIFAWTK